MLSSPASLGLPDFADSSTVFKIVARARSCRSFASQTAVAARAAASSAISADGDMVLLALRPAHITFRHEECAHEEKMQHWSRLLYKLVMIYFSRPASSIEIRVLAGMKNSRPFRP